ncbi:MAG: bifunctional demethylmenaquinone methyltransferase/2-methoxy-6-polyprenyl-1,4-benzoquinol methylase UbiE [Planctomycetota bacterium]
MQKVDGEIWDRERLRDPHNEADKQKRVRDMFAAIAPSYDLNNRLWSLGIDQSWRRKAVKLSRLNPDDRVVDVACGTGDLTLLYASRLALMRMKQQVPPLRYQVLGIDYTFEMLPIADRKRQRLDEEVDSQDGSTPSWAGSHAYLHGDAQNLPLADASSDVISIAFGIRNVGDSRSAYGEFFRVLRPGGRVVVLEFSKPTNRLIRTGYDFYFNHVLTRLASLVARDKTGAYRYLASSVETFKPRHVMQQELEDAGFVDVTQTPVTFGVAVIYVATKPA